MKLIWIPVFLIVVLFSCKKDDTQGPSFSEARYTIIVTGKWATPAFTTPGSAHYTSFVGMVHNSNAYLWKEGTKASPGTEAVAESGNTIPILAEIDSMVAAKNAIALFAFIPPAVTGSKSVNIYCNSNYPLISFESMLGPTPDWFVGISGLNLYNNNKWTADTTVNLYPYDAGTEDGDVLAYNNPASVPQQNVHLLLASQGTALANGNLVLAPIATARFIRQ
jgi:Spondin_N